MPLAVQGPAAPVPADEENGQCSILFCLLVPGGRRHAPIPMPGSRASLCCSTFRAGRGFRRSRRSRRRRAACGPRGSAPSPGAAARCSLPRTRPCRNRPRHRPGWHCRSRRGLRRGSPCRVPCTRGHGRGPPRGSLSDAARGPDSRSPPLVPSSKRPQRPPAVRPRRTSRPARRRDGTAQPDPDGLYPTGASHCPKACSPAPSGTGPQGCGTRRRPYRKVHRRNGEGSSTPAAADARGLPEPPAPQAHCRKGKNIRGVSRS